LLGIHVSSQDLNQFFSVPETTSVAVNGGASTRYALKSFGMLDDAVPFVITFWVTRHTSVSEPIVSLPESILQVEPLAALVPVNSYESSPFEYVPAGGSNTTPRLNGTLGS
jgi:hypothetical protein